MRNRGFWLIGVLVVPVLWCAEPDAAKKQATFYESALPVLAKHCQQCHQPGAIGPMSLVTYEESRPWAQAIREAALLRRMPPWYADPHASLKFSNDRSLSDKEMQALITWVDQGAPRGEPTEIPVPPKISRGWKLGTPDVVLEMDEIRVPAKETIDYTYFIIPTGFTEDKWVSAAEFRIDAPAVVHHMNAFIREPDNDRFVPGYPPRTYFVPRKEDHPDTREADEASKKAAEARRRGSPNGPVFGELLAPYEPGLVLEHWKPGQARLIKAGSDIVIQCHFTANGKATPSRSALGITFAKGPVTERVITFVPANTLFKIPPGHPNYRVDSSATLQKEAKLLSMQPHMHLRGKAMHYYAIFPGGEKKSLLSVPRYSFDWQLNYYLEDPLVLPSGTRLEFVAYYDNSPNNPYNPDPTAEVRWGDQSWEEMMIPFLELAFDPRHRSDSVIYRNE